MAQAVSASCRVLVPCFSGQLCRAHCKSSHHPISRNFSRVSAKFTHGLHTRTCRWQIIVANILLPIQTFKVQNEPCKQSWTARNSQSTGNLLNNHSIEDFHWRFSLSAFSGRFHSRLARTALLFIEFPFSQRHQHWQDGWLLGLLPVIHRS